MRWVYLVSFLNCIDWRGGTYSNTVTGAVIGLPLLFGQESTSHAQYSNRDAIVVLTNQQVRVAP